MNATGAIDIFPDDTNVFARDACHNPRDAELDIFAAQAIDAIAYLIDHEPDERRRAALEAALEVLMDDGHEFNPTDTSTWPFDKTDAVIE